MNSLWPAAALGRWAYRWFSFRSSSRRTLRHSYARALRRVEAPLEAVQAALDHSNLATTSIYLRQLEGQEDPWWPKLAAELGLDGGREAALPEEEQP